jgi:hypothetical protein
MSEIITNNSAEPQDITVEAAAAERNPQPNPKQEHGMDLADALAKVNDTAENTEDKAEQANGKKEPGYVAKRVSEAAEKAKASAIRETEERMTAYFEKQIAPLREAQLNRDADDLVKQGEFKSRERALEYLRLKQGVPPVQQTQEKQREEAPVKPLRDPALQARAEMLMKQAEKIMAKTGVDVMAVFNSDISVRQKVSANEWDFYDIADSIKSQPAKPVSEHTQAKAEIPPPMRTSNNAAPQSKGVRDLSPEEFVRFKQRVKTEGWRVK